MSDPKNYKYGGKTYGFDETDYKLTQDEVDVAAEAIRDGRKAAEDAIMDIREKAVKEEAKKSGQDADAELEKNRQGVLAAVRGDKGAYGLTDIEIAAANKQVTKAENDAVAAIMKKRHPDADERSGHGSIPVSDINEEKEGIRATLRKITKSHAVEETPVPHMSAPHADAPAKPVAAAPAAPKGKDYEDASEKELDDMRTKFLKKPEHKAGAGGHAKHAAKSGGAKTPVKTAGAKPKTETSAPVHEDETPLKLGDGIMPMAAETTLASLALEIANKANDGKVSRDDRAKMLHEAARDMMQHKESAIPIPQGASPEQELALRAVGKMGVETSEALKALQAAQAQEKTSREALGLSTETKPAAAVAAAPAAAAAPGPSAADLMRENAALKQQLNGQNQYRRYPEPQPAFGNYPPGFRPPPPDYGSAMAYGVGAHAYQNGLRYGARVAEINIGRAAFAVGVYDGGGGASFGRGTRFMGGQPAYAYAAPRGYGAPHQNYGRPHQGPHNRGPC